MSEKTGKNEMPEMLIKKLTASGELTFDSVLDECGGNAVKAFAYIKYLVENGYIRDKKNGKFEVLDKAKNVGNYKKQFPRSFIKNLIDVVHRDSIRALFDLEDKGGIECEEFLEICREEFTYNPVPFLESCGAIVCRDGAYFNAIPVESFGDLLDFLTYTIRGDLKDYEREICFKRWAWEDDEDISPYDCDYEYFEYDESKGYCPDTSDYDEYYEEDDRDEEGRIILDPDEEKLLMEIIAYQEELKKEEEDTADETPDDDSNDKKHSPYEYVRICETEHDRERETKIRERTLRNICSWKRLMHATLVNENGMKLETDFIVTDSLKDVVVHAIRHSSIDELKGFFGREIDARDLKSTDGYYFYGFVKDIYMELDGSSVRSERIVYPNTASLPKSMRYWLKDKMIPEVKDKEYVVVDKKESFSVPFINYLPDGFSTQLNDKKTLVFYVRLESDGVLKSVNKMQRETAVEKFERKLLFTSKRADLLISYMNLDRFPLDLLRMTFALSGAEEVHKFARGTKIDKENLDYATAALDEVDSVSIIIDDEETVLDNERTVLKQLEYKDILRMDYGVVFRVKFKGE